MAQRLRRHRPAIGGGARAARSRRGAGRGDGAAGRLGAVWRALSRERVARAADPARVPGQAHAAVAAALEGPEPAGGGAPLRRLPDRAGDLQGVPARRAGRAGPAGDPARPAHPRDLAGGGGHADPVAVCVVAAVRLRGDVHVRGRHAERGAPRGGSVAGPRAAARAARPGGAARADRPGRAGAPGGRPAAPLAADARDRPRRPARRAAPGGRPQRRRDRAARVRRRGRASSAGGPAARAPRDPPARGRRGALRGGGRGGPVPRRAGRDAAGRPAGCLPGGCPGRAAPAGGPLRAHARPLHGRGDARPLWRGRGRGAARARARRRAGPRRARPAGTEREWCDVEVLRRLRRASLAALRKEIEPTDSTRLAAFLPSWQGVDRHTRAGAGIDRLREVLVALQGLALPAQIWERDVLPRRTGAYSQTWLDALCASGEVVWVGAGPLGRSGRVALYFREDAPAIGPPPGTARAGAARDSAAVSAAAPARLSASGAGPPIEDRPAARSSTPSCAPAWPRARASSATCWPSWTPLRRPCARRCGTSCGRARSRTTRGRRCARRI